jgi:nucleoside-diphosphate-sugar epimerase
MPPSLLTHLPIGFQTPGLPGNHYALSKTAGEDMLAFASSQIPDLSCYSIRFPWIFLPNRYRRFPLNLDRFPTMLDEAFAYLMANDAVSLMDHLLRNGKPGHHILMPSANDNHLNLRAADIIQLFFKGVPHRKPVDPEARTLFDIAGIEEAHGWAPKETSAPVKLFPEITKWLNNMLEEAWKI